MGVLYDIISDLEGLQQQDQNASCKIRQGSLHGQSCRDAKGGNEGGDGSRRHAEKAEDNADQKEVEDSLEDTGRKLDNPLLHLPPVHRFFNELQDEADDFHPDPPDDEGQDDSPDEGNRLRQEGLHEFLQGALLHEIENIL